jgi:alkane 1-monooxygenase
MQQLLKKIGFLCAFSLPLTVVFGYYMGGGWNYSNIVYVFVLIPLLDELLGKDHHNLSINEAVAATQDTFFNAVLYVWVYVQLVFLAWCAYVVATHTLSVLNYIGFCVSVGLVTGGVGITVAHELGHKTAYADRLHAKILLMTVCYMHFYVAHNRGHHVWVATPKDAATSRLGENFYSFWLRTVIGSWQEAWHLEQERLRKKNITVWSWENEMVKAMVFPLLLATTIFVLLSLWQGVWVYEWLLFFVFQSIIAFSLLELVNYIEHYGILRKEIAPNKYEKVNPLHSWNANQLLSNLFLFQLQRHSDHHANALKPYQTLNDMPDSPQLPAGYPVMILVALFPPLWFRLMNPRLQQWRFSQQTI